MSEQITIQSLEDGYRQAVDNNNCPPENKLQYLNEYIFDITTYDEEMDEYFAKRMIPVIECILNRKTFDYFSQSKAHYINYLTMVNMPFLYKKLEWGGSIRGAWPNTKEDEQTMRTILEWVEL